MLKIPYGVSNFEQIRTQNFLYVDKTHFVENVESIHCLIYLRPRRFGKSLFISMLNCYYDIASADKFDELFKGLYIHEHPTVYRNSYYILRFNFSGIEHVKPNDLQTGFVRKVREGAQAFINKYQLEIKMTPSSSAADLLGFLLGEFANLKLSHKVYILIDEYDHFTNALLAGDGAEFLSILRRGGFVRSFYEVIKEHAELGIVERIFMTGVMSVTLDSMTSGFNIATKMTTAADFADMMGFREDEVKNLLTFIYARPGRPNEVVQLTTDEQETIYEIFEENYNGYLFSERSHVKVFNATLIMYYLREYLPNNQAPSSLVDMNLNQTGATIESIVKLQNGEQNYQVIEEIMNEKQVEGTLQPFINIDVKFDKNDLITLLFNIGLLTIKGFDVITQFEVPNKVIKNIYLEYLSDFFQKQSNYTLDVNKQQQAMIELGRKGEITALTALVSEFLTYTSQRNAIKFDEKYIKLIYMMILVYSSQFSVYDEFPALQGYSDLFIQKAPHSTARYDVLIEFKYIKKSETTAFKIEEKLAEGVKQIERYMADERLAKRENLKKFVVVFSGFEAVMSRQLL